VCPALEHPGMITASLWFDMDQDKQPDLVIAGEWMPIRFFKNNHGHLQEVTEATGIRDNSGMWRSLAVADIDHDGDMDIIAGNLGLNCIYHVSPAEPMKLFAADIDGNGSIDPVLCYYNKDEDGKKHLYPAVNKSQLAEQVPVIKKQFLYNKDYAKATVNEVCGSKMKSSLEFDCTETRSCYFENKGGGRFVKHALPMEAQFAPVNAIVCEDVDSDGYTDLLLAGNEYQAEPITGRYDASYGCFLKGNGKTFTPVPAAQSGLIIRGDVKDMKLIHTAQQERLLLVAVNNDSLRVFRLPSQQGLIARYCMLCGRDWPRY
ncbi:MAG TPA: VCBS repeat-containing protein, partial [Chitinophagaceae bacterium]|nr:VCBS repeat-containing protein [Chitinophagaceae bacterium]